MLITQVCQAAVLWWCVCVLIRDTKTLGLMGVLHGLVECVCVRVCIILPLICIFFYNEIRQTPQMNKGCDTKSTVIRLLW